MEIGNCSFCNAGLETRHVVSAYPPRYTYTWKCGSNNCDCVFEMTPECIRRQREAQEETSKDPQKVGISGRLTIEIHDGKTGQLLTKEVIDNTIVTAGLNLVRDLLAGNNAAPSHIAVGTDATAPAAGDTTLGTEVFRNVITRRIPSATQITFQLFLATGDANGNTLVEAGIFNASSAGDMLSRVTYTSIAKTSAITVTLTWDITISEA